MCPMSASATAPSDLKQSISPEIQPGLLKALTTAYAMLLKRQRTASSAYVRWTAAHSRAHEFAWMAPGQEQLLSRGQTITITSTDHIRDDVNKMMATIELNPYERELVYGYPYIIAQIEGKPVRAPLFTIPVTITTDGGHLTIAASEEVIRFNSLPHRSDFDTPAHELALSRLIEATPELPLSTSSLQTFCAAICRELGVVNAARLDGTLEVPPAQPRASMPLTLIDNAACFIAPKTSYFLVSDLESIGGVPDESVSATALGWLLGKRPPEPTSDIFQDRKKLFYPFPSNPSQRRVAHLVDDPKSRITVVQGPPGTGKSLTIANLACHLIATGKRVLITSQKDKALSVVDDLLSRLDFPQLPMTLLRQDRESRQELRERLERVQKDRSAAESRIDLDKQLGTFTDIVERYEVETDLFHNALVAEHAVHHSERAFQQAAGFFARLSCKWKLIWTLRSAERSARLRSDSLGEITNATRTQLQAEAISVLAKAAEHRTCEATKTERNQLREFSKLLGRNQANFKNYPVFDRMKAEPDRCEMLLKILPCWIMTPDDVARLFPCKPGLFDVVIIDEASQCDLPSMAPVLFRAKQAVVAGDSKQMQAQRFAFTSNQVAAQAWTEQGLDRLDPDRWLDPSKIDLLQLASIRMDEEAFLDEHYRSLPAIIGFSNHRWYGDRLRIMRDAEDKRVGDPGAPAIALHRVNGEVNPGTQENYLEAGALVAQLRSLLEHPGYADSSFGIICLFEEQMRLVNDLTAEQISEELRAAHQLVVVNPDGFQGDERDVILYSLSFDAKGMSQAALSARQADREHIQGMLNVAFTRARDEMHIFHSADLNEFIMSSGSGTIRDWLEHCSKQQFASSAPTPSQQIAKAQSDFEAQVLTALTSKGVGVIAQYPCCGYSIDIVAERDDVRVAIECDGEVWHLDEHGKLKAEDLERQEVLERAGWHVIRVPYRGWRENPDGQIDRVLNALTLLAEPADSVREDIPVGSEIQNHPIVSEPTAHPIVTVDKFEHAIIEGLKNGNKSRDEVFRSARGAMGYSRMGNQIHASLQAAAQRLQDRGIIRAEEDELFFSDDNARRSSYRLGATAFQPRRRNRRRSYSRYGRW
jgi:very-short-patch-repair endonuclease